MKRRKFIYNIWMGIVYTLLPYKAFSSITPTFSPYHIDRNDPYFEKILKEDSFPKAHRNTALKIDGVRYDDNHAVWIVGEGRDNLKDSRFSRFGYGEGYTPVAKIIGIYEGIAVYGQWKKERNGNLTGLIEGWDKGIYKVYNDFQNIFTNPYKCYGLPTSDYENITCRYCGLSYIKQNFKSACNGSNILIYSPHITHCNISPNGNHDNIKVKDIPVCSLNDKINYEGI